MTELHAYKTQPSVIINGRRFVDEEYLLNLIDKRIREERKHSESEEERNGMDICRNIVENVRFGKEQP